MLRESYQLYEYVGGKMLLPHRLTVIVTVSVIIISRICHYCAIMIGYIATYYYLYLLASIDFVREPAI